MPKGYWIARVDVRDPEGYKGYVATAKPAFERFGAKFLARGRNVVIEFDSVETAKACYDSPEYTEARAIRQKYADAEMVIVEGV